MSMFLMALFLVLAGSLAFAQDEHGNSGPLVEESAQPAAPPQELYEPAETIEPQEEVKPPPPPARKKPKAKRRRKLKPAAPPTLEAKSVPATSPSSPLAKETKVLAPPPAIPATPIQPFNP